MRGPWRMVRIQPAHWRCQMILNDELPSSGIDSIDSILIDTFCGIKTHQSPTLHKISTNLTRHLSPFAMALCMPRAELRLLALRLLALHFACTLIRWFVSDSHPRIPTITFLRSFVRSSKEPLHLRPISAGSVLTNLTLIPVFLRIWVKVEGSASETLLFECHKVWGKN